MRKVFENVHNIKSIEFGMTLLLGSQKYITKYQVISWIIRLSDRPPATAD